MTTLWLAQNAVCAVYIGTHDFTGSGVVVKVNAAIDTNSPPTLGQVLTIVSTNSAGGCAGCITNNQSSVTLTNPNLTGVVFLGGTGGGTISTHGGLLNINSQTTLGGTALLGVGTPSNPTDAANKSYVDGLAGSGSITTNNVNSLISSNGGVTTVNASTNSLKLGGNVAANFVTNGQTGNIVLNGGLTAVSVTAGMFTGSGVGLTGVATNGAYIDSTLVGTNTAGYIYVTASNGALIPTNALAALQAQIKASAPLYIYDVTLSQSGTAAPNILGTYTNTMPNTVIWAYESVGVYSMTCSGCFPFGRTQLPGWTFGLIAPTGTNSFVGASSIRTWAGMWGSTNKVYLLSGSPWNGLMADSNIVSQRWPVLITPL